MSTHLASIIAGRDVAGTPSSYLDPAHFAGIAPDATLVNVKVGASNGAVDVTQVIAGIDWVVEHSRDNGLNIRVINLAYGTESVPASQSPVTGGREAICSLAGPQAASTGSASA